MALLALRKLRRMQKRRLARKLCGSEFSEPSQAGAPIAQKRASNDTAERNPKRTKLQKKRSQRLDPLDERKSGNASAQNEEILIMPRAVPHAIDEEVFSDNHNIGQGRLLQDRNSQKDGLGLSRTSLRRERAISSGSEPISLGVVHRKPAEDGLEEGKGAPGRPC